MPDNFIFLSVYICLAKCKSLSIFSVLLTRYSLHPRSIYNLVHRNVSLLSYLITFYAYQYVRTLRLNTRRFEFGRGFDREEGRAPTFNMIGKPLGRSGICAGDDLQHKVNIFSVHY
jgi:hypothetical protein